MSIWVIFTTRLGLRILVYIAILALLTSIRPAGAHRINALQQLRATGVHHCTWSAAKACTRWRARGGKFNCALPS
jgi:hypothetical protein